MSIENLLKAYDEPCFAKKNFWQDRVHQLLEKHTENTEESLMQKIAMMMCVVALTFVACNEHPGEYSDANNNNEPAVNNNNSGTNDNNCCDVQPTFTAWSTDMLATWVQKQDGSVELGAVLTPESCDGERARYDYYVTSRPMVFLFSASTDLTIQSTIPLEAYIVNQNPDDPWSFWVMEFEIKEFYGLDPFWHIKRFPTSMSQAEGFKYSASAFICGKQIDAINLGCWNVFEDAFFEPAGNQRNYYFEEDEFGEIFVLIVVR